MITDLIGRVSGGQDLGMDEMSSAIDEIMQGAAAEQEIALLLTALRAKGETPEEVAGAALAMRKHMTVIRSDRADLLDTCGTGGDGSNTFNISTAAAIVTAAAGVPVAKHGNRAMSSKTGSADVLAELGVNVDASVEQVEACLSELGICFCFAQKMHQSMKHVAAVRKKLGVRTIFNLLGPLCNPAGAPYQLLGVGKPELRNLLADALGRLGTRRAAVVCGEDGLDEVTLGGTTRVTDIQTTADGEINREETSWTPADFGLEEAGTQDMLVSNSAESAAVIRQVLAGTAGTPRNVVVLNSAAALWLAGKATDLKSAATRAALAIDDGSAKDLLARLAAKSHAA
jgi:anthranilate phosphoribosyltransferase